MTIPFLPNNYLQIEEIYYDKIRSMVAIENKGMIRDADDCR